MRNGTWGALCADGFGSREAAVACRQLGYSGAAAASYTTQVTQLAWIANVTCQGTEARLVDCPHEEVTLRSCPNGYATLTCTPNPGARAPAAGQGLRCSWQPPAGQLMQPFLLSNL